MCSKVWDEIIYNGATVEVLEWMSNFIPNFIMGVTDLSMLGLKLNHVSKGDPVLKTHTTYPNVIYTPFCCVLFLIYH